MPNNLRSVNYKLAREHGYTGGKANYIWQLAGDCTFPLHTGDWTYRADDDTGLIHPAPVYEMKNMCRALDPKQWVLCRYLAPPTETEWKNAVGLSVEYPANGYYAPTNVELDLGINPWDESRGITVTDAIIAFAKQDRGKTRGQIMREGEEAVAAREAANEKRISDTVDECMFSFPNSPHIPGERGGPVSLPFTKQDPASILALDPASTSSAA